MRFGLFCFSNIGPVCSYRRVRRSSAVLSANYDSSSAILKNTSLSPSSVHSSTNLISAFALERCARDVSVFTEYTLNRRVFPCSALFSALSRNASHAVFAERNSWSDERSQSNRSDKIRSQTDRNVTPKLWRFLRSRASYLVGLTACLPD